ncbi:replicative DNA helicase [Gemmata sp.]|uniref:replicative DNA helicase n=1 Tax=Gemmata sp. TaxID=1914242 RepID=UPI003F6EE3F1
MPEAMQDARTDQERAADVERQLLGCCLWSDANGGNGLDHAAEMLTPADFGTYAHAVVFETFLELRAVNAPVTAASVAERLRASGKMSELGPNPALWLADTLTAETSDTNAAYYTGRVKEAAERRQLRHVAVEIAGIARDAERPVADSRAECEQLLFNLSDRPGASGPRWSKDLVREAQERIDSRGDGEPAGILTGFEDIDRITGGLKPGQMIVIGARPAVGKSALATAIAANAAEAGHPVLFASLEMSSAEVMERVLASRARIPLRAIQDAKLTPDQSQKVSKAGAEFAAMPFGLCDTPNLTAARFASMVRRAVRQRGVKLAVIDYLQLMQPENRKEPRHLQVGELSRNLKLLARACNIPVIVLAQLNRASENRADTRPQLSDLRESGNIEADADTVMLLHTTPNQDADALRWNVEVLIRKNRGGPPGEVTLHYVRPIVKFENARYA